MTGTTPQPGWYPNPSGELNSVRYWDGSTWTDIRALEAPRGELAVAGMDVADAGLKWTGWSFAAGWKLRN